MLLLDRFLHSTSVLARPRDRAGRAAARDRRADAGRAVRRARRLAHGRCRAAFVADVPRSVGAVGRRAARTPAWTIDAVRAALLDARDGCPRAVDVLAADASQWRRTAHDIAREARAAGFVPVLADVLGELLRSSEWQWPRWLADRSLVVLTCDGQLTAAASLALLRLASRDARPHVVIRGATSALSRPTRLIRLAAAVHEDADAVDTGARAARRRTPSPRAPGSARRPVRRTTTPPRAPAGRSCWRQRSMPRPPRGRRSPRR